MKIAIDLNGVVRDVFGKTAQTYEKFYIEELDDDTSSEYDESVGDWVKSEEKDKFNYELNLPVTSLNLIEHFKFEKPEDLYDFFYVDFPMQIFGHSSSIQSNTFNILNDLYVDLRDNHEITIISDEIGKSKPATLFFLSKYGCLVENIKFYSKINLSDTFNAFDVIITSNPDLLSIENNEKTIIKVGTTYNSEFKSDYTISGLDGLNEIIKKINL
jgi:hypothetical protein|tara:strand:+ start:3247 stop:3891 length:645 start_codon:yes stop_codon:yes gene_type:complete